MAKSYQSQQGGARPFTDVDYPRSGRHPRPFGSHGELCCCKSCAAFYSVRSCKQACREHKKHHSEPSIPSILNNFHYHLLTAQGRVRKMKVFSQPSLPLRQLRMRQRKAFGLSEIRKDQLLHYFTAVWQLRKRCWKPWLTTLFPH